jgi:mRNA-degrading endonuclease RelE of RelBE toxin-antitoxin system
MPGNNAYQIEYLEVVIEEDIPQLPKKIKAVIKKAIEERLMTDPVGFGKPLRYSLKGHRRLRAGDYRIVFRIEQSKQTVLVTAIKHRKDVYDE